MSEPRVGVFREHGAPGWTWQCSGVHVGRDRWSGFGAEASIAAAADAGRRHLAEHHAPQPMTPLVQTIVAGTRCTCGDLPRSSYPWFTPCPVHSWLVNTTTAQIPEGYSRRCGVRVAACAASECRCVSMPADTVGAPEKPAQRFGPCDRPDCPICAVQHTYDTSRSDI